MTEPHSNGSGVRYLSPDGSFEPTGTWSLASRAGDFIFIEPGVPHEVYNLSDTEPVVAVVARSDANERPTSQ